MLLLIYLQANLNMLSDYLETLLLRHPRAVAGAARQFCMHLSHHLKNHTNAE